jgi:hypothetical protein
MRLLPPQVFSLDQLYVQAELLNPLLVGRCADSAVAHYCQICTWRAPYNDVLDTNTHTAFTGRLIST